MAGDKGPKRSANSGGKAAYPCSRPIGAVKELARRDSCESLCLKRRSDVKDILSVGDSRLSKRGWTCSASLGR